MAASLHPPQPHTESTRWSDESTGAHHHHVRELSAFIPSDPALARDWGTVHCERVSHRIDNFAAGTAEQQFKEQQVAVRYSISGSVSVRWRTALKQVIFGPPGSDAAGPHGKTVVCEEWVNQHDFGDATWAPQLVPPQPSPPAAPSLRPAMRPTPIFAPASPPSCSSPSSRENPRSSNGQHHSHQPQARGGISSNRRNTRPSHLDDGKSVDDDSDFATDDESSSSSSSESDGRIEKEVARQLAILKGKRQRKPQQVRSSTNDKGRSRSKRGET